jgi:hypothetical protein
MEKNNPFFKTGLELEKLNEKKTKILGWIGDIPIIECRLRKDFFLGLEFFCDGCKGRLHKHGMGEGYRHPHCIRSSSRFIGRDYFLVLNSEDQKLLEGLEEKNED